ncbi:peptidoglycan DD-metalloendopeptidase family protein [Oryzobacter sp. R7]|uniref:peptidoglycan DD-metalloendopeptidase family protein n=1 Tax=Oryzobacter faecalis TaxID=3388656 RepID=UPI00398CC66A
MVRRFRAPPSPYAAGHRGLDLAATAGAPVLAVEDGIVTHRGWVAGRQTLTVHHRDGLESTYEPVAPTVAEGVSVAVGQQLGVLAPPAGADAGHCGARTCLHLGARRGEGYLDPWPLLRGGRVVLLPLR